MRFVQNRGDLFWKVNRNFKTTNKHRFTRFYKGLNFVRTMVAEKADSVEYSERNGIISNVENLNSESSSMNENSLDTNVLEGKICNLTNRISKDVDLGTKKVEIKNESLSEKSERTLLRSRIKVYAQIIITPSTADFPGGNINLLLVADRKKYIFGNCPAGYVRYLGDHHIRPGNTVQGFFATGQVNPISYGGMAGYFLTVRERSEERASGNTSGKNNKNNKNNKNIKDNKNDISGIQDSTSTPQRKRKFNHLNSKSPQLNQLNKNNDDDYSLFPIYTGTPNAFTHYLNTWRHFLHPRCTLTQPKDINFFSDDIVNIKRIRLVAKSQPDMDKNYNINYESDSTCHLDKSIKSTFVKIYGSSESPQTSKSNMHNSFIKISSRESQIAEFEAKNVSTCYIVDLTDSRGKFQREIAESLNIDKRLFGNLTKGIPVKSKDGLTTIYPDQVLGPSNKGTRLIILHIPSEKFLESALSKNWAVKSNDENNNDGSRETIVIHSLGEDINPLSKDYLDFCKKKLGNVKQHFFSHPLFHKDTIQYSVITKSHMYLNSKYPRRFSLPQLEPISISNETDQRIIKLKSALPNAFVLQNDNSINIEPEIQLEKQPSQEDYVDENALRRLISKEEKLSTNDPNYKPKFPDGKKANIQFITLGTGSACPSPLRNVSANLMVFDKEFSVLMDCGEGTCSALRRKYGTFYNDLLCSIRLIYISHMHADHHLGVYELLKDKLLAEKSTIINNSELLYIIAPVQMLAYLEEIIRVYFLEFSGRIGFIPLHTMIHSNIPYKPERLNSLMKSSPYLSTYKSLLADETMRVKNIRVCLTNHTNEAYCVCFDFYIEDRNGNESIRIAYSGDTPYWRPFIKIAKDCDVLIHEATFSDDMRETAMKKMHSTWLTAFKTGKEMNAKNLIYTHFSQRYPTYFEIDEYKDPSLSTITAFDGMNVDFADFK